MSAKDKQNADQSGSSSKTSGAGSCLRPGIQESDTADSGEESEPTYRHYDNFETDVCLTQDEDEDEEPLGSKSPVIRHAGIPGHQHTNNPNANIPQKDIALSREAGLRNDIFPGIVNNLNRGLPSSDSDTESEMRPGENGQTTDDTTTNTSTSESEETQIWVPISKRPSALTRQDHDTTTPPPSASSSNGSDHSRPQSYIHKAGTPGPGPGYSAGSLTIVTSPGISQIAEKPNNNNMGINENGRRDSKDSWHNIQANLQSSGVHKRVSPSKQMSLGLIRHDETTGTITLDIRNVPNGDSGLGHEDDRYVPSDDALEHPGASASILRNRNARAAGNPHGDTTSFKDSICTVCSALYMLFVVVAGIVVPVAEIFAPQPYPVLFEGFYIYLHVMSQAFLVYAYTYLLRVRTFPLKRRGRTIVSSVPVQNRRNIPVDDVIEHQTGSFYLRLGAVGFGIGSMIKSGLHFGEYFEMTSSPFCSHVLYGIRPLLHLCFTFVQLYFVFLNAKMMTHRYKLLARFGLMHMIATNMSVWLENVVKETLRQLGMIESSDAILNNVTGSKEIYFTQDDSQSRPRMTEVYPGSDCYGDSLMGEVVETSSPYLYPCTVLYSLICTSILFIMWVKLGKQERRSDTQSDDSNTPERSHVDCSSSSRGLFLGIIVFVAIVIILITFFVLVRTNEFMNAAVRLDHLGDVVIFVITTIAVILAFHRTHALKCRAERGPVFEEALLVISLIGVYVLCVSNIIAGVLTDIERNGHLIILSNCLRIIQTTVQTIFLLNTMRRRAWKKEQEVNKPGREFVTFLLICNIALWGMNIFEVQRSNANPVQAGFYGNVAWNIITHISVPLMIFFRFHSTVCLANIWKHAWKCRS